MACCDYILGLDLGTNSIGWAVLDAENVNGKLMPSAIRKAGVRIFDAGTEGDIESGRDLSRNTVRREKRQMRRQLERRSRRKKNVLRLLQREDLLPEGNIDNKRAMEVYFQELDNRLFSAYLERNPDEAVAYEDRKSNARGRQLRQLFPYELRARGAKERLELHELGRTLYHLAQRRGFKSNKKGIEKDDEIGKVKESIKTLAGMMEESAATTLGAYFASLNPEDERIRGRYTARKMFEDEFATIWNVQRDYHPELLTDDLYKEFFKTIFHQRKLKSQKGLVGGCELEKGCRRAPVSCFDAQRFRMLQMVNNMELVTEYGEVLQLTPAQRSLIVERLENEGDATFSQLRKLLKTGKGVKFNYERGGEKKAKGNRTNAELRAIFGERWATMEPEEKEKVFHDLFSFEKTEALEKRARNAWGLNGKAAKEFAELKLEQGYSGHSRKALKKLLPELEAGTRYATAKLKCYPEKAVTCALDSLIPVKTALPELRNPIVERTLTELRKVVNNLVAAYGKPALIRVELARDMKNSRKQREEISRRIAKRRKARERAAKHLLEDYGEPRRRDIEKYLLWEECGYRCPYTGNLINMYDLFGPHPQFDIEHIIPFSRSLDNSFANKTLCDVTFNREVKRNKTPYECLHGTQEWEEVLSRVKKFTFEGRQNTKLLKFMASPEEVAERFQGFESRQLNDTRYASTLARRYLGLLYGEEGMNRVQIGSGQVTSFIRRRFDLNRILSGEMKTRDDHRHHAVDAIAIALTSPLLIQQLANSAKQAEVRSKLFVPMEHPWESFFLDAKGRILEILPSFRVNRKVSGAMHKETNYGERNGRKGQKIVIQRKLLSAMSKGEAEGIVDGAVREAVAKAMKDAGKKNPGDVFKGENETLVLPDGRKVTRARFKVSMNPKTVGEEHVRNVQPGSNHHLAIYETRDAKGKVKWTGEVVTMLDAYKRKSRGLPVVDKTRADLGEFKFTLSSGDMIYLPEEAGQYFRVRSISNKASGSIEVEYVSLQDARLKKDIKKNKQWFSASPNSLQGKGCRKIILTPLGEVRWAND